MDSQQSQFRKMYVKLAQEHLKAFSDELSNAGSMDKKTCEELLRRVHTLKGQSAAMEYRSLAKVSAFIEGVLREVVDGKKRFTQEEIEVLLSVIGGMSASVDSLANGKREFDLSSELSKLKKAIG